MKTGAFGILRVEIVLSGDVSATTSSPGLWTGFPAKITHRGPFFSLCRLFLCRLWTFAFKSKGGFDLRFVRFRDYSACEGLE
jgi:hypothetical protein